MKELQQYDGNQLVSWDKCDWKPPMKMSEAITKGATIATPDPTACYFSDETGRACLIGLALVGYVGDFKKACELRYQHGGAWPTLKKLFGADGDFGRPCAGSRSGLHVQAEDRRGIRSVAGVQGPLMRRAFDSAVLQSVKICAYCARPFEQGSKKAANFRKAKFCNHPCSFAYTRAQGPARFWEKVDKGPHPKGCWLYTGFRKWDGYGWLNRHVEGKPRWLTAHRYAWILTHGVPAAGMHIMHLCDIPACCNPEHLKLGTHDDNMADMKAKGRNSKGYRKNGHAVLHPDRVRPTRRAS